METASSEVSVLPLPKSMGKFNACSLLLRIGDDAFRHILVHTSIFLPVQNNCYMQLSGVPVYEKYQHFRIGATESQPSMTNPDTVKTKARGRKRKRKSGGEVDRDQGIEVQARKKQRSGLFKR
jgi:telomerase reverse transcriptase